MNWLYRKTKMNSRTAAATALTVLAFGALFVTIPAQAQTVTTLYSFNSNATNTSPTFPQGTMAQGRDGNFYGISYSGDGCCQGIVYKISSTGALTSLHQMLQTEGTNCNGLMLATDGNFYGTCSQGGIQNGNPGGTIIKVTPSGAVTVLHSFPEVESLTDGCVPRGTPVQAADGNFYGTTGSCGKNNYGMVYKITAAGVYTQLYSFQGGSTDVAYPYGALIQANDGNLWGTGNQLGLGGGLTGNGGVFKITLAGKETKVFSFANALSEGDYPQSGLIQGFDGNFYGTTFNGGMAQLGTIFKLTPAGVETVLWSFPNQKQGALPQLVLTQGPDGLLYGAATDCGSGGCSQAGLFDITTKGAYSSLYLYPLGVPNSVQPLSPLLLSTKGKFYSTTAQGGTKSSGSFYSLSTNYSPFISLVNIKSGKEGTQVGILGQGFTSASVVKFGGTTATTKTLTGSTFILATVPAGALTGKVTVTTGTTTLSTMSTYKVTPTLTGFTPASGPVATSVTITGTGLAQTTKVTFNKVAATFTVNSDSKITATVPTGATTGKIAVITPGGSATSSASFTVN